MLKKFLIVGAIAAVVVVGIKATRFGAYVRDEARSAANWADDQIPVDKKIATLRKEVSTLDRDIDKVKNELAKEIVAVRELTTKTNELRASVDTEQKGLLARGQELKDATEKVKFGGTFISVPEAKDRLNKEVQVHLTKKKSLDAHEKALNSREKICDTLQKQFEALKKQKDDLKVEIDNIEAEYKALQLQQIESKYQTDDSRLASVKKSLADLKRKLEVEKTKLELEPRKYAPATIPGSSEASIDDILAPLNNTDKIDAVK
jgi:chromosome segregation ATPase